MNRNGVVAVCIVSAGMLFTSSLHADSIEPAKQVSVTVIADGKTSAQVVLPLPRGAELGVRAGQMVPTPGNENAFRLVGNASVSTRLDGVDLASVYGEELLVSKQVLDAGQVAARAALETMLAADQSFREKLNEQLQSSGAAREPKNFGSQWKEQQAIDRRNQARLDTIVKEYGWPTFAWAGRDGVDAAFLVVQHADLDYQRKYLPTIEQAVAQRNLSPSVFALLEDRIRVREGKKQIYGTQLNTAADGTWVPYPIEDEANVDARRARVGLGPLAEYVKGFGPQAKPQSH